MMSSEDEYEYQSSSHAGSADGSDLRDGPMTDPGSDDNHGIYSQSSQQASEEEGPSGATDLDEILQDDGMRSLPSIINVLVHARKVINRLNPRSQQGLIQEGTHYKYLRETSYAIRAVENATADGAHYLGDIDLSNLTFAEKVDRLSALDSNEIDPEHIALEDSKSAAFVFRVFQQKSTSWPYLQLEFSQSDEQARSLSHLHLAFTEAPGMVAIIPAIPTSTLSCTDMLLYHTPIPPQFAGLAFPLARLPEAHESLHQMYTNRTDYEVPGARVKIAAWDAKPGQMRPLQSDGGAGWRSFKFLFDEIQRSAYARERGIKLDFAQYQPLGGDGVLLEPETPREKLEFKEGLIKELRDDRILRIIQPARGKLEEEVKRRSIFSPLRTDNFVCLFDKKYKFVYWLPAEFCSTEFWSGKEQVDIPMSRCRQFRIDIDPGTDWIRTVYKNIIRPYSQSKRPDYSISNEEYLQLYPPTESLRKEPPPLPTTKGMLVGYPWWKIERWNRHCAHTGYGIYLPLKRHEFMANVVWMGHVWDLSDKKRYFATGELPKALHPGDIHPLTPLIPIRAICVGTIGRSSLTFPSNVAGFRLDRGPFPFLCYVDCETFNMRAVDRSGLLFPSEFIDYDYLNTVYSEVCSAKVSSCREFMQHQGGGSHAHTSAVRCTDLSTCLTVPFTELMVREGQEFDDAINQFADAHVNEEKLVSWLGYAEVHAKSKYMIQAGELFQALATKFVYGLRQGIVDDDSDPGDEDDGDDEDGNFRIGGRGGTGSMGLNGTSDSVHAEAGIMGLDGTFDFEYGATGGVEHEDAVDEDFSSEDFSSEEFGSEDDEFDSGSDQDTQEMTTIQEDRGGMAAVEEATESMKL